MRALVGDIGGTKTLLYLVEIQGNNSLKILKNQRYASQSYDNFYLMVQDFLEDKPVDVASIAIAGPVINNSCNLTNLNWVINGEELAEQFKLKKVALLNDFAAISYGVLQLKESELFTLQAGEKQENSAMAVIGAGTGLGQSFLVNVEGKYQVFSTEGGHSDFAPRNELEWELLKYLKHKFGWGRVSAERVISGQGIVGIYQFLRDSKFASESSIIAEKIKQWENGDNTIDAGAIIGESALKKEDILTSKTLSIFMEAYAAEISNFALKILPYGGIYVAGGIAEKILPLLKESNFLDVFLDKGRMTPLLQKMPLKVVKNHEVGLWGSIYSLLQM